MHVPVEPDIGLLGGIDAQVGKRHRRIRLRVLLQEFHLIREEFEQVVLINVIEVVRTDDQREQVNRAGTTQLELLLYGGRSVVIDLAVPSEIADGPAVLLGQQQFLLGTAATLSAVRARTVAVGLVLDAPGERQGGYRRQGDCFDHVFHLFWNFPQRYTKNRPY